MFKMSDLNGASLIGVAALMLFRATVGLVLVLLVMGAIRLLFELPSLFKRLASD